MAFINKQDTNGSKALLSKGEFGYDDYVAGGDTGRVYIGTGSSNIALATKSEVDGKLSSGSYTASDVLAKIKTVDGTNSGLDADLLDGQHGSYYLPAGSYTASDVLAKIKTVDGSGSGLDADLLDGYHGSTSGTANTYARRDSAADITARLFRSTYAEQTTAPATTADICFRNNTADNYMRFMDSTSFKTWCDNIGIGGSSSAGDVVSTYNAVGSMVYATRFSSVGTSNPNSTISGTYLRPCGINQYPNYVSGSVMSYYNSALSGTWRCLGYSYFTSNEWGYYLRATLWVRIA